MFSESERSGTLDTLPEGKQVYSGSQSTYRKVYPDWKPSATLDKTDVVGAMEAVEEIQPTLKDKSAWRKSNLNVANSTEETKDDSLRYRHTLPRIHSYDKTSAPAENDRKGLISALGERAPTDKLTLYLCKPSDNTTDTESKSNSSNATRMRSSPSNEQSISNKVEIDQDNIETPPATRRIFTPTPVDKREPVQPSPCSRLKARASRDSLASPDEPEPGSILGDGQFDRFSATRRTRRYKRNTENTEVTSPELVAETQIIKPNIFNLETSSPVNTDSAVERETRLQAWKERLRTQTEPPSEPKLQNRRSRNQTGINQDDLKRALTLNVSPPITIDKPALDEEKSHVSMTYINPSSNQGQTSNKIDIPNRKAKEHDNDEGFEETQSLMSESPSQGASSGGNYEPDLVDSAQIIVEEFVPSKPLRVAKQQSNSSLNRESPSHSKSQSNKSSKTLSTSNRMQHVAPKMNRNFDRTSALRQTTQEMSKKSVIPRRSGSLRKTDSQSSVSNKKHSVQRSNSRNSIVSSRSSLNSATSTNTVKRVPLKTSNNTSSANAKAVQRSPSIKGLNSSSKSGSNLKRTPSTSGTGATQRPPRPSVSSFMKPTTASATKSSVIPNRLQGSSFRSKN